MLEVWISEVSVSVKLGWCLLRLTSLCRSRFHQHLSQNNVRPSFVTLTVLSSPSEALGAE